MMVRSRFVLLLSAALLLAPSLVPTAAAQGRENGDVAIVVHPDTPVSDLSLAEVRKIFLGDRQYWKGNTPVVLLVRAPVAREREVVLKTIYRMTEARFKQYWISKIFTAEAATAPKIVYSSDQLNALVAGIPGAIGFMPARDVQPGVKVVRVDGRLPGEPFYPLK